MYIKNTGDTAIYPYSLEDLRRDNPNVSFPLFPSAEDLALYDVFPVSSVPKPTVNDSCKVTEGVPELRDGAYFQVWVIAQKTEQEVAFDTEEKARLARLERNTRLMDCDWTQLPDVELTDIEKTEWSAYRKALRDITEQVGFPNRIEWPTPPQAAVVDIMEPIPALP